MSVALPTAAAAHAHDVRQRINLAWLIRLRWGAVIGQLAAVLAADRWLQVDMPVRWLLAVLAITVATNAGVSGLVRRSKGVPDWLLGSLCALDIALLTALLYFTGGSTNPFKFLYLVHIALAAVILRARWIAGLLALSFACFVALFFWHVPLGAGGHELPPHLRSQGTAAAFVLAAGFIVYFVHRLTRALTLKEAELAQSREVSARNERLTSLATLAAGAAHELSTPLATIAVVAKELEHQIAQNSGRQSLREDALLIREQVQRCRDVLQHMAADAGASCGEPMGVVDAAVLVHQALDNLPHRERVSFSVSPQAQAARLRIPERSTAQALRAVIKNALEASTANVQVQLGVRALECRITVRDGGHGMDAPTLARVSEPFFTTKEPGVGMGLGLFLTRTVLERLGGSLQIESEPRQGTVVVLALPLLVRESRAAT